MGPDVAKEAEVSVRAITKFVRCGAFAAEVNVEIIEEERSWAPYLSLEDAYKLDDVRDALHAGDVGRASRLAERVYRLTPVGDPGPPERDTPLEEGEELLRRTSRSYDGFWRSRLEENDCIAGALRAVADGATNQAISVPGLTKKGKRSAGWSGSMCVWAKGLSGGRGAVHVQSLGRVMVFVGILEEWPNKKFRISINHKGNTLSIKPEV